MPDDKSSAAARIARCVVVSEVYDLRDWAKKFGVSEDGVKAGFNKVGERADAVGRYFKGKSVVT